MSKSGSVKTLVDTFYYPAYGTGTIYENHLQNLEAAGREVATSTFPVKIGHNGRRILWVDLESKGSKAA